MISQHSSWAQLVAGVAELIDEERLSSDLAQGRPLRVKAGFDPTTPNLHLGHAVLLNKLRDFQQQGHIVIFLIGDFTSRIGDPTGKSVTRPSLSKEQIIENTKTYCEQVYKLLDADKTHIRYNSEWFDSMSAADMIGLASQYTVARMLERDDFAKRYAQHRSIAVHEFLYPLVQGYDSVALAADVELGGIDQKFNLLVGRELQKNAKQRPQAVMMMPLLEGVDGVHKMSQSLHNDIAMTAPADEMFGKMMSLSDDRMWHYYTLLSAKSTQEIERLRDHAVDGCSLRDAKVALAYEMVQCFHGYFAARAAQHAFEERFRYRVTPPQLETQEITIAKPLIAAVLKKIQFVTSTAEAYRLVQQGGIKVDGVRVSDPHLLLCYDQEILIQVGQRKIARVYLKKQDGL